jgi:hypothetical protein
MAHLEPFRDQQLDFTPDQLIAGVAEQQLGTSVHEQHFAFTIDEQQRAGRDLDDQTK